MNPAVSKVSRRRKCVVRDSGPEGAGNETQGKGFNMNKTIEQINAAIDETIAARKEQLPAIQGERSRVDREVANMSALIERAGQLAAVAGDQEAEVMGAVSALKAQRAKLRQYQDSLSELEAEFTRDTLNIGVSGEARTGKSTTLQKVTGLSDEQIPSGGLNPVTAVRSEIYNSSRSEAIITFKTEEEFTREYLVPHVDNVNACLPEGKKIKALNLAALKVAELPERLEGYVSTAATDSLKRLKEAKRSASTFEGLLGAAVRTVSLDKVHDYVTYPSAAEEASELACTGCADRRYLAVKLAQVYCPFPNLGDAKVALVDLPGLGEIGNFASQTHLKGLEDKVDQIFLVMRPRAEHAFADAGIAANLDQLGCIQPAVRRGDLVVAGINRNLADGDAPAKNLRAHFEAEINAGRSDRYELVDYCATDADSVTGMFGMLLDRLGTLLPEMDRQKLDTCMGSIDVSAQVSATCEELVRAMDCIMRRIPSSDRVMKQRIDSIERAIIGDLNAYAMELSNEADEESESFREFLDNAQRIHDEVAEHIGDGLFRAGGEEWDELTSSSKDYYNLYRDEAKRIRYEIIDAYCGLDGFYGTHVSAFKQRVLDTVLGSCGLDGFFRFATSDAPDARIAKVASELGSTLRDDDLDAALRLLTGMRFDFRSNVFLRVEENLANLANPSETFTVGYGYGAKTVSKREVLGGFGDAASKQSSLREYLVADATEANDAILEALQGEEDCFNRYLAVSIDFFNNYLYGKDEDNFKQVVLRGMIREYKEYVLPDADDASKSPLGKMAAAIKESAQTVMKGKVPSTFSARKALDAEHVSACSVASKGVKLAGFKVGQVLDGIVNRVDKNGAYVAVKDHYGFVPKGLVADEWVDDVRDFLKRGQKVRVKVSKVDVEKGNLILSVKHAK